MSNTHMVTPPQAFQSRLISLMEESKLEDGSDHATSAAIDLDDYPDPEWWVESDIIHYDVDKTTGEAGRILNVPHERLDSLISSDPMERFIRVSMRNVFLEIAQLLEADKLTPSSVVTREDIVGLIGLDFDQTSRGRRYIDLERVLLSNLPVLRVSQLVLEYRLVDRHLWDMVITDGAPAEWVKAMHTAGNTPPENSSQKN